LTQFEENEFLDENLVPIEKLEILQTEYFGDNSQILYNLLHYIQQEDRLDFFKKDEKGRMNAINILFQMDAAIKKHDDITSAKRKIGSLIKYLDKEIKTLEGDLCADMKNTVGADVEYRKLLKKNISWDEEKPVFSSRESFQETLDTVDAIRELVINKDNLKKEMSNNLIKGLLNSNLIERQLKACIDEYKEGWESENEYFVKQMQVINLYYSQGKVEDLVKNKELGRLLARKDFLNTRNVAWMDLMSSLCSLGISLIASVILQIVEVKNFLIGCLSLLTIFFSFFMVTLSRYSDRGQAGSYRYLIDQYEIELLSEKIKETTKKIQISCEDELLLKTKQNVITALICLRKKTRKKKLKEQIKQDIILLEKLDLCLGEYDGCYKQAIYVNGSLCYLVYDKEKGKETNYMGKSNLRTRDYVIFKNVHLSYITSSSTVITMSLGYSLNV